MSGAMENRAAVFTSSPQDVEVYLSGGWRPASMLGWRHEPDGSCRAWVRVASGGADDTAWCDLAEVRLPEPAAAPSLEDAVVPVPSRRVADRPRRSSASDDGAPSEMTATMNLYAVRDVAEPAEERRPVAPAAPSRRLAAEVDDVASAAAYWAAFDAARGVGGDLAAPGRHRAPATVAPVSGAAGRHRAADTGMMPAVAADGAPTRGDRRSVPPAPVTFPRAADYDEPGADLYTRPMRLTAVPQQRTGGWDAALGGF